MEKDYFENRSRLERRERKMLAVLIFFLILLSSAAIFLILNVIFYKLSCDNF
jgi:hypothetical protein